jgi:hypothetical protein
VSLTVKFLAVLARACLAAMLWKLLYIEAMVSHFQDCMYFNRVDQLMYRTRQQAGKAYAATQRRD